MNTNKYIWIRRFSTFTKQEEIFFKGMIRSQFSYCPLIWMFCSRKSNNLINKVHERSLRIVSGDNHSSFKSLLSKYKEIAIHQRNLQVLMTETYGIINGLSLPIMENFFILRENTHNVRSFQEISNENRETVKYGIETMSNRTPFIWANLPNEYKLTTSLHDFKLKINWHCDKCVCGLSQNFQQNLGFV